MSTRKLILSTLFLFSSIFTFANSNFDSKLDSLLFTINQKGIDTSANEYFLLLQELAYEYGGQENYLGIIRIAQKAYHNKHSWEFPKIIFRIKLSEGSAHYHLSQFQKAIAVYSNALTEKADFITGKDSTLIYRHLGDIHFYLGNFQAAYQYHLRALKINEASGNTKEIANFYYAEGLIFSKQHKYKAALKSYIKSLHLTRQGADTSMVADLYSVIGDIYFEIDSVDLAIQYQQAAFKKDSLIDYQYGMGYGYFAMGKSYAALKEFDRSLAFFNKAYKIRKKIGDPGEIAENLAEMGKLNNAINQYDTGQSQLNEALKIAQQVGAKPLIQKIYNYLAQSAVASNQYEAAFEYQRQYFLLKDSILNEKSLKNVDELKSRYQLEKKEQQITLLQKDKELNSLYWQLATCGLFLLIVAFVAGKKMYDKQLKYNLVLTEKNEEIKAKNQKLERANEDLEQFAYISSHDLKAPLRTVGSFASLLQRRYKNVLDEEGQEFITFIISGVQHMNVLLEDVYNYTHIDKVVDKKEVVDLNVITKKVIFQLDNLLKTKQATVDISPLPKVYGNATFLSQVFQNLIQNGIKFMPPKVKANIRIAAAMNGNQVQINVIDNGIGIAKEYQAKIFTIFRRLHTSEEYEGTGVGLAICKKIVERSGGSLWVTSDGHSGSCFSFTLNLADEQPLAAKTKELLEQPDKVESEFDVLA